MADTKITALTALTAADPANDVLPIVDVSDTTMAASGTTKKISVNNILGASGTATLASATITGDLTVDTSTLKVDSTNNRVGIVNASPSFALDVNGAGSGVSARISSGSGTGFRFDTTRNISGLNRNYLIGCDVLNEGWFSIVPSTALGGGTFTNPIYNASYDGIHAWSDGAGSERMRLNSTGLGVGVASPATKLDVRGANNANQATFSGTAGRGLLISTRSDSLADDRTVILNAQFATGSLGQLVIQTAGTDRLLVDASGNVGIGVTPSAWRSTNKALQVGSYSSLTSSSAGDLQLFNNAYINSGGSNIYQSNGFATRYEQYQGVHAWYIAPSGTAGNTATFTQAMTLDASGRLLVGTTSTLIAADVRLHVEGSQGIVAKSTGGFAYYPFVAWNTATSGDNVFSAFGTEATYTARGSISYNRAGGLVAYNTTSDYRAKDIIGPVSNSGSLIDSLKVYVGKMKGATIERPMLIAHETQEVAPYAVTGTKDEVDSDGKPKYQQMDASALVPLLIAEIQSLRARVQTLETR